jgi:hypothetical protein
VTPRVCISLLALAVSSCIWPGMRLLSTHPSLTPARAQCTTVKMPARKVPVVQKAKCACYCVQCGPTETVQVRRCPDTGMELHLCPGFIVLLRRSLHARAGARLFVIVKFGLQVARFVIRVTVVTNGPGAEWKNWAWDPT